MKRSQYVVALAWTALLSMSAAAFADNDGQAIKHKSPVAPVQTSCGKDAKQVDIAQNSTGQNTTSSTFVDVTGSEVSFNIGGNNNTCVLVDFSGQVFAPGTTNNLMFVKAVLDNSITSVDGQIQLVAESNTRSDAHAYNFLFTEVPPGAHTVKMQYEASGGGQVSINDFNMVVYHK